jgi:hypothetical protein
MGANPACQALGDAGSELAGALEEARAARAGADGGDGGGPGDGTGAGAAGGLTVFWRSGDDGPPGAAAEAAAKAN